MGDLSRDNHGQPDEDRLPWLEPVDEEPVDDGVSAGRLIAGLVVALIALGLVVGGVYWLKQRASGPEVAAAGDNGTIQPPATPYKVKPAEPGGMQIKGQGDSSYAASEGADKNGQIDLSAVPEQPIAKSAATGAPAKPAPAPAVATRTAPVPAPAAKPAPAPAPAPQVAQAKPAAAPAAAPTTPATGGGGEVQLGAFAKESQANTAWKSLSGRFAVLAPLNHSVVAAQVNGKTVYRLRASGGNAHDICAKLKVAGETCLVVG